MIRRPPRSTPLYSSAASDVYKRQHFNSWPLLHADDGRARGRLSDAAGHTRRAARGGRSAGHSCPHVGRQAGRSSRQTIRRGKSDRGGTVTAAVWVAKAPADGYTLMFTPSVTLTTNATLYK